MDPHRKRRANRVGTALPDPELAQMTDADLQAEYERELDGTAALERERAARERGPWGYLADLTDDALLEEHRAAGAAYVAGLQAMTDREFAVERKRHGATPGLLLLIAREVERRTPQPVVVVPPVFMPVPVFEPHPVMLETPAPLVPTTEREARIAEQNAIGLRLIAERTAELARQDERDRALAKATENDPMEPGSVIVAPNATAEVRAALNAKQQ